MKNIILLFLSLLSTACFGQHRSAKIDTCSFPPLKWEIFYPKGFEGRKIIIRREGLMDSVIYRRKLYEL
jgi:hypothetical protein